MPPSLTAQVATLHQRLDDATRRAESLRRVIEAISGELALAPLLTRIIQCAVELIGADDGTISWWWKNWMARSCTRSPGTICPDLRSAVRSGQALAYRG